jgi:hypothetical protein
LKASIIILVCLAPPYLCLADTPYAFHRIELGSDIGEILDNPRFRCSAGDSPVADTVCHLLSEYHEEEAIDGASLLSLKLHYLDENLSMIVITFLVSHFERVKDALQQEYGTPSSHKIETYVSPDYKLYKGDVYLWENSVSSIDAVQFYSDAYKSAIVYRFRSFIDELNR